MQHATAGDLLRRRVSHLDADDACQLASEPLHPPEILGGHRLIIITALSQLRGPAAPAQPET